jgi:hypothetical protein
MLIHLEKKMQQELTVSKHKKEKSDWLQQIMNGAVLLIYLDP